WVLLKTVTLAPRGHNPPRKSDKGRGHTPDRPSKKGGHRPGASREPPQLRGKECLADSCVAVNVEQETAPLIINGKSEILLVLNNLSLTANETALLALPDAVLQRPPFRSHPPSKSRPLLP